MNRELKFRAWDTKEERMHFWDVNADFDDSAYYRCYHSSSGLMQYTGLKDKNGKEIYEGDILRGVGRKKKWVLKWMEDDTEPFGFAYYDSPGDFEVIGNIYENPELLKE